VRKRCQLPPELVLELVWQILRVLPLVSLYPSFYKRFVLTISA
jgi:hypothetical protein